MSSSVTTEQYSLRWNNFQTNLKSGFHDLLEHAEMVDVTLAIDGQFLQAHKVVLSICSNYFRQMFKTHPCKHPIVILKDVGHENMKDILQFMYMGEVSVLRENLSSFLRTAEILQVKGLTGDDSTEEPSPPKETKLDINTDDDNNELYNQLIETTTDVDMAPGYSETTPPVPPQNTPLPLSCPKRQIKSLSPSNLKRSKCSDSYPSSYSTLTPDSDTPKPNLDYKSCDLVTTQTRDVKPAVGEIEEAKDYSKSGTNVWKTNLLTVTPSPQSDAAVGSGNLDQSTSEQDLALYPTDSKGHVFCPYCCRKFVNRYNLKVHIRDKHESKSTDLDCQVCGKTMRNQSCLRVHLYHHRKQQMENSGMVSFNLP